jgi:hypothetical protein
MNFEERRVRMFFTNNCCKYIYRIYIYIYGWACDYIGIIDEGGISQTKQLLLLLIKHT